MKKLVLVPFVLLKLLKKKYIFWPAMLIVLAGLIYFERGWIRKTAEPKTVAVTYGHSVKSTAENQLNAIGNPFEQLGYKNISKSSSCWMATARSIHTEVICNYQVNAYSKISDLKDNSNLNTAAATIEKALKANGWGGTYSLTPSPYTSLTRLTKSLTSGIDYQPDAAYAKTIGKVTCMFDSNTAYSKPAPPAIASSYVCSRSFNVLGSPWQKK